MDNHRKLSRVLMEEPSKIYIGDLRKALIHIGEEESMTRIRNTNIVYGDDGSPAAAAALEAQEDSEDSKSQVNPEESI